MITIFCLGLIMICVFMSGFFSGSESGMYFVHKDKLSMLSAKGDKRAEDLLGYLKLPGEIISMTLIGNTIVLQLATYCMMFIVQRHEMSTAYLGAEIITTLSLFLPFFFFGEVFPKATYRLYAQNILLPTLPVLKLFLIIFKPLTWLVHLLSVAISRLSSEDVDHEFEFDRHHLTANLGHAYAGGVLSIDQIESLNQALNVGGQSVETLMTPLMKGVLVSDEAKVKDVYKLYKHNRIHDYPVYSGKRTKIIGYIDIREVVLAQMEDGEDIKSLIKPPVSVQKGEPFVRLFKLFFEVRSPMIFVKTGSRYVGFIKRKNAVYKLLR